MIGNPSSEPGVPLLFSSDSPFTSAPRSSVQAVYDQIEADLNASISAFGNGTGRQGSGASAKSQLNINTAYGLLARMALSKGDWQTAASAAIQARDGFPLMNEADWLSGFNSNNLSEVIWGSNVIATETTFFRSYFYLMSNTFNGSQIRNNPKIADRRVVDAIPETDYRKKVFIIDAPNTNHPRLMVKVDLGMILTLRTKTLLMREGQKSIVLMALLLDSISTHICTLR